MQKLTEDILQNNLNDEVSYQDFFHAFGYKDKDQIYCRLFSDKKDPEDRGAKRQQDLMHFDSLAESMHRENTNQNRGVFFVVNGPGNKDPDIKQGRAAFADFDDFDFSEQIRRLNEFELEPSIIVKTKKSLHPYWLFNDAGDVPRWNELQHRLINYFGSDPRIENPSRVMRLYGFEHRKSDPVLVKLIKFNPEIRYSMEQLNEALPMNLTDKQQEILSRRYPKIYKGSYIQTGPAAGAGTITATQEIKIPEGCSDLTTVTRDKSIQWLSRWAKEHNIKCKACGVEAGGSVTYEVDCPWKDEHTVGEIGTPAAIIVSPDGKFGYNCFHGHCFGRGWKDFRAFYDKEYKETQEAAEEFDTKYGTTGTIMKRGQEDPDQHPIKTAEAESGESWNLKLTNKGIPKKCFFNYVQIIRHDPYFKGKIRENALHGRTFIRDFKWDIEDHPLRDVDVTHFRGYMDRKYDFSSRENIEQAISVAAHENAYHPIIEMLDSLKWDGKHRIRDLLPHYLGAEKTDLTEALTRLMFNGAIMRVKEPGVKFDVCIVLADTKQGTGKSSMCRFLALKDEWYTDSLTDLGNQKQAYEVIQGHWIIELGEMIATKKTALVESIKMYLTQQADDIRVAYGRHPEHRPRQCIYVGTTNKPHFLPKDLTGNRRFYPVICDGNNAEEHPMADEEKTREYIKQCYAEALEYGAEHGFELDLEQRFKEELDAIVDASTPEDRMIGEVQRLLDEVMKENVVCVQMIWDYYMSERMTRNNTGGAREAQQYELDHISDIMDLKIEGWTRYRGRDGSKKDSRKRFKTYGRQLAWERIKKVGIIVQSDDDSDKNCPEVGGMMDNFMSVEESQIEVPFKLD